MTVHNAEVATAFEEMADLLEIEGANPFRVRAYRFAARTLRDLPAEVAEMVAKGEDLTSLPGIGDAHGVAPHSRARAQAGEAACARVEDP